MKCSRFSAKMSLSVYIIYIKKKKKKGQMHELIFHIVRKYFYFLFVNFFNRKREIKKEKKERKKERKKKQVKPLDFDPPGRGLTIIESI